MADDPRTFKMTTPHMEGGDVRAWQAWLVEKFDSWHVDYPLTVDGDYGQATRSATASMCRAWGIESAMDAMADGVTPRLRIKLRQDDRSPDEVACFRSVERTDYRRALREKHNGGGVAMPVAKIIADSNDWAGTAHDGIDLICPPESPLFAICRAKVVRAANSGWWGQGNPGGALGARGDGIVIIQSLVDAGPIREGDCFGYGHAEKMRVEAGDTVSAGEWIATSGFAVAWHPHWMRNTGTFAPTMGRGDADPRPVLDYCRRNA